MRNVKLPKNRKININWTKNSDLKQQTRQQSTSVMLQDLPEEILFEIFDYFDFIERNNLLNLTLVCKKFNSLISNNTKLMKNLPIMIRKSQDESDVWNGTRKYSRLDISKMIKEVPKILDAIRNDMTCLSFHNITMDATELKKILLNCPKLFKLNLASMNLNYDDGCFDEPMPRLDLESLSCSSDRNILKMLMCSQTKSYVSGRFKSEPGEIEAYRNFLKVQKKLEKINFIRFSHDSEIFNDEALNEVEFRLKFININNIQEDFEIENFKKFLKNHLDSLQHIEIQQLVVPRIEHHAEILNSVAGFQNLKSLDLYQIQFPTETMPYVEKLKITLMGYDESSINWSSKFPNVKNLHMSKCQKIDEINKLKKLETLTLTHYTDNDELDKVLVPSTVKNFKVYEVFPKNNIPFIFGDHQIENFTADELVGADWIGDFLRNLKDKLKFLKIERCFLSRNRRFSRLFEKEPELMNKTKSFVFIDWKDEYDEESIASDVEEPEGDEDVEHFADLYDHEPQDEIDWECLAYEGRQGEYSESDEDNNQCENKRSKLEK